MRVLQVFNQYLEKGGEEFWVEKIPSFAGNGVEFSELRFRSSEWTGRGAPSRIRQARLIGDNPDSRRRLKEAVNRVQPDVLLFHNLIPVASLGLYDEARRIGLPVVQYLHNYRPFSPSGTLWVNGRVNEAAMRGNPWPEIFGEAWNGSMIKTAIVAWHLARLRRSGALDVVRKWIAVSEFVRSKFIEAGFSSSDVETLRHCWYPDVDAQARDEGDFYLFLGRLHESKGVRCLLDAWNHLAETLGSRCPRLVIAGAGELADEVREASRNSDDVEYVGFVSGEEKASLLASCRALIAPSVWREPLGLIVYEAYEHFRPAIVSASGGLSELVEPGKTGLLHQAGDPESLASAVVRMEMAGGETRRGFGQAGRRFLESIASPERWRRRFLEILGDVSSD